METFAYNFFFFIVAIGVLITFHEFGHFVLARKLGVKVLRFSIGFGTPLWRYQRSPEDTEYVIGALPLGGYVKMVDESEGEVPADQLPYAFNRQSLPKRIAIVAAGPLFNLLLAVVLYWVVLVTGEVGMRPIVGPVPTQSLAAEAGFRQGDEILVVEGEETPTWSQVVGRLTAEMMKESSILVEVKTPTGERAERILKIPRELADDPLALGKKLGLKPWEPSIPPVIERIEPDSPAEQAGLQPGDLVTRVNGKTVADWRALVEVVRENPGRMLQLEVVRSGTSFTLTLIPQPVSGEDGKEVGHIGAGVKVPQDLFEKLKVTYRLGLIDALSRAVEKTAEFSWLTLKMMGKMVIGEASVKNLSGPISIAQYAGQSAALGLNYFLKFLAIVSISLGVLNLLPIPVLDGGHLMFYLIEGIRGRP